MTLNSDKALIENIPTEVFNGILDCLLDEGWEAAFVYDGIDAWIDYGMVELSKGGVKLLFEWTNWFEGVVCGSQNVIQELAERFDLKISEAATSSRSEGRRLPGTKE
jgi:hypothetical protein